MGRDRFAITHDATNDRRFEPLKKNKNPPDRGFGPTCVAILANHVEIGVAIIPTPELLSSLIGDIYDTTLNPELWPSVLERSCVFVQAAAANIFWQDAVDQTATIFHAHGDDPRYTSSYLDTYIHLNPLYPAAAFIKPGIVFTGGDLVPHDEFRQTRFYTEWVAPQGFADAVGVNIQRYPTSSAMFSLRLGADYGVADDEARRRIGLIAPHIQRAVLIGRQIQVIGGRIREYETLLDAHGAGVFLVDENGQLRFANAAGRAMLEEGTVVNDHNDALTPVNARAAQLLRAAASGRVETTQERGTVSIALTDTTPRWLADILPLRSGSRLSIGRERRSTAAIFVRRAEIPAASGIEIMAELYKLRASEVRVLQAMTKSGGSVDELGEALGISGGTVKTHLNALFAKTGTNRRADLLREVAAHGGPLA